MKRLFLLLVGILLLVACGVDSIPQEGLSNAVSMGWEEGVEAVFASAPINVAVADFQCNGIFIPGKSYARVSYRVTTNNEALGAKTLFGGGLMELGDNSISYDEAVSFTCEGSGQLLAYQANPEGDAALVNWLLELRASSLTAQIDGVMMQLSDVIVVGLASTETAQVSNILTNNENITELSAFQCEGRMIPNSSQASITFTAETKDGRQFVGGGILETGVDSTASGSPSGFQCNMQDEGWINAVFEPNSQNYYDMGQSFMNLTISTLQTRDSSGKQQIMFETLMAGVVFEIETN